jgi:6-phosphogluconolactonase
MTVELRVVEDPAREAAALLVESGRVIALSGGTTAGPAYRLAAEARPDWTGMQVWFADERAVPPYDERSNYRLVRTTLIDALSRPPEMHRIKGELGAEEAAARYDDDLEGVALDFALNGIGADGHTASLFPGSPAIVSEHRAVAAEAGLEPFVPRVTLTPPIFAQARLLVYLVTGEEKATSVRRAFAEEPSPATPASLVRGKETIALLDAAAASLLL